MTNAEFAKIFIFFFLSWNNGFRNIEKSLNYLNSKYQEFDNMISTKCVKSISDLQYRLQQTICLS